MRLYIAFGYTARGPPDRHSIVTATEVRCVCVRLGVRTQWPELHARAPVPRAARAPTAVVAVGHSSGARVACTIPFGFAAR